MWPSGAQPVHGVHEPGGGRELQTRPDQVILKWSLEGEVISVIITNISEAKANLSKLIERVRRGEEVVIGKAGRPIARLVPFGQDATPRTLGAGAWKGRVEVSPDFDDLPEELARAFAGELG